MRPAKKKLGDVLLDGTTAQAAALTKDAVRALSVSIVIKAVVSFRSVPRIFHELLAFAPALAFKVPCHNSVINLTLRYGHRLLSSAAKLAEGWFAIVDMSIETGRGKALVVLRVPLSVWARKDQEALALDDCEAIGVDVRADWNAQTVKASLETIFEKAGKPAFIIKDQGSDIDAGVRLLELPDVQDIGHKTANALKDRGSPRTSGSLPSLLSSPPSAPSYASHASRISPRPRSDPRNASKASLASSTGRLVGISKFRAALLRPLAGRFGCGLNLS